MVDIYCGKDPYENYITKTILRREHFFLKLFTRKNILDKPLLTPYLLDTTNKRPAIIILPGGAFVKRATKHISKETVAFFHQLGFNVFVLHYRVSPYFYPIPVEDGKRAVRYLRYHASKYCINPDNIGMIGFSAGGHIVSLVATSKNGVSYKTIDKIDYVSCKLDFQILSYPCTYLSKETIVMRIALLAFIGKTPKKELLEKTKSINFVTKYSPKTFIWHTKEDKIVPSLHSNLYAKVLKEKGVQCELHIFNKGPHGLGMCQKQRYAHLDASNWPTYCKKWLQKYVL